jgi:hypothetical protein
MFKYCNILNKKIVLVQKCKKNVVPVGINSEKYNSVFINSEIIYFPHISKEGKMEESNGQQ